MCQSEPQSRLGLVSTVDSPKAFQERESRVKTLWVCSRIKQTVDVGDFVGVHGGVKKTDKGEVSVVVHRLEMLTKTLRALPDKWNGLTDIEKRYRQRCPTLSHRADSFPDIKGR